MPTYAVAERNDQSAGRRHGQQLAGRGGGGGGRAGGAGKEAQGTRPSSEGRLESQSWHVLLD